LRLQKKLETRRATSSRGKREVGQVSSTPSPSLPPEVVASRVSQLKGKNKEHSQSKVTQRYGLMKMSSVKMRFRKDMQDAEKVNQQLQQHRAKKQEGLQMKLQKRRSKKG
jgi:hypothetical protein